MKKHILIIHILFTTILLPAQNLSNNWFFGGNSGVTFSSGSPIPVTTGELTTIEGTACASDPISGNLLFYSDGINVWDKTNTIMPSGTGLLGCSSSTMSALAVPLPLSTHIYYLFTADCLEDSGAFGFNYNIIDMDAHAGLGDVVSKNNLLLAPSGEVNHAVKHANCIDYWIVARGTFDNKFYAYLLTAGGLSAPVVSSIGAPAEYMAYGQGKFSPDGSKFAVADGQGGHIQVFDFDNATGTFSNPFMLFESTTMTYGVSFSPDNSKLYAPIGYFADSLTQWNLVAGDTNAIRASKTFLGKTKGNPQLQIGKDYKIYIPFIYDTLSVINNPNFAGIACNFVQVAVTLGDPSFLGLPEFPESEFNLSSPCPFFPFIDARGRGLNCHSDSSGIAWVSLSHLTPPYSILWSPGGMSTDTIRGLSAGIYYVSVTDSSGIIFRDTVIVTEPDLTTVGISATDDTVCPGTPITLSATGLAGGSLYSYLWNTAVGIGTSETYTYTPESNDIVFLTVRNEKNCPATNQLNITMTAPVANFTTSPANASILVPITFTDLSTVNSGTTVAWQWDFGDSTASSISTLQNPVHSFAHSGTYIVSLAAQSNDGCWDTVRYAYEVVSDLFVPNVFTPNNDGSNDYLMFKNLESYPGTSIAIYNRWGEKIYSNLNYQNDWNGQGYSDGVYYFILSGDKLKEAKYGFVQLIR